MQICFIYLSSDVKGNSRMFFLFLQCIQLCQIPNMTQTSENRSYCYSWCQLPIFI